MEKPMREEGEISEELTVFYHDDAGNIQGPYESSTILHWYGEGYFNENHIMRITDNGQHIGNKVTIVKSLGDLKKMFGNEAPIPLTVDDIPKTGFPAISLNPLSNRVPGNALKWMSVKQEVPEVQEQTKTAETSIWEPAEADKTLPTPRKAFPAGPSPPPTKNDNKRARSRSPSYSQSPPRRKKEVKRNRSYSPTPSNSPNRKSERSSKQTKDESTEPHRKISASRKNLPFYHGDREKEYDRLKKDNLMELVKYLRSDYENLEKNVRNELFKNVAKWDIPDHCKVCERPMSQPANFLSHVLSEKHIMKSVEKVHGKRQSRFTLKTDYLPLRREMDVARIIASKSPSPVSQSPKPQHTSRTQTQPSQRQHHHRKPSRDNSSGPYHSNNSCRQS